MTIKLKDKVVALAIVSMSIDTDNKITGTKQVVLKDEDTGHQVNDGEPVELVLSAEAQAAILQAISDDLSNDLNASTDVPPADDAA